MTQQVPRKHIVVLGLGNILNSDEGLGVHALREMKRQVGDRYPQVVFVDGGTLGLRLMPLIEETSHLLILDCVNAEKSPGTLVELTKDQIPLYHGIKMSMHQITFQEILGLADIRKFLPQYLHLVGVQPMSLVIGSELSQQVQDQLPHVILQAEAMLQQWLDDEPSV